VKVAVEEGSCTKLLAIFVEASNSARIGAFRTSPFRIGGGFRTTNSCEFR
jgi:hypothetical protein